MAITTAGRFVTILRALLAYVLLEAIAYKAVGFFLRVMAGSPFDYQDWVFLFYFPEKKIKFIYYLVFMFSTWAYFLALSIYFNAKERADAVAD